jgi:ligand-binding sensor domain-containing protein
VSLFAGLALGNAAVGPDRRDDPAQTARHAIRIYDERDGVGTFPFECLDTKGYLWCGTQDGIQRYNGHEWTHFALSETTRSNWICSIQAARDGGIWFGTNGNGLHHWKDGIWTSYTLRTGFPGLWVPSLAETLDDTGKPILWIGTGREGLWQATTKGLEPVPIPGLPAPGAVNALLAARDGSLWVGCPKGLAHLDKGKWTVFKPGDLGNSN